MIQDNNQIRPNTQSLQMAVIANAIAVVEVLADKYSPKEDSTWFEYRSKEGYRQSFDEDQGTYCEDCIDERESEILMNEDNSITFPDDFKELIQSVETSKENVGFLHCDSCGEMIECAIIWDEQELEHWTGLADEDWQNCKNNNYHYYQVHKILEECYGATEEYPDECLVIAQKVLEHWC